MIADRSRAPTGEMLLGFERVSKCFGATAALADVTLDVRPGQFVVLLGPSGSGKTTLLRCAAGIERITSGRVWLGGAVVDDGRRQVPPERRDLAMVFQDYALWPHMSACQNVAYALRRLRLPRAQVDPRARAMLGRVGLGGLAERYPSELSGGEQQRVALARALVARPRLLLFDEPLSNLDATLRDRLRIEIAVLVREVEASALYITHDQAEAFALADRIGVLDRGRLVQFDIPEAIYGTPATPFVARLTGLAGELAGRVVGAGSGGLLRVAIDGDELLARPVGAPDRRVRVMIRPAAVQLGTRLDGSAELRGLIRDVAFAGRGYEHVVELSGGQRLAGVFDDRRWSRGESVRVRLDPARCLAFEEDVAAPGSA